MSDEPSKAIDIHADISTAYRNPDTGRIFTLMGPNGAGKSRLLEDIEKALKGRNVPTLRLPAARALSSGLETQGVASDTGSVTLARMLTTPLPINSAVFYALDSIFKSVTPRENKFKDQLYHHVKIGATGPMPKVPKDEVLAFKERVEHILGNGIAVSISPNSKAPPKTLPASQQTPNTTRTVIQQVQHPPVLGLSFNRDGIPFDVSGLSDGEKQILMLVWMLNEDHKAPFVFLVDEPELFLNEARAVEFWELIERYFPRTVFLYATHNIVFATRPNVNRTYLMGMDHKIEVLPPGEPVPHAVVRDMVGARVQILRTTKPIIFCEDTLLRHIASDLLASSDFEFVVLEGYQTVVGAVSKDNRSWGKVRSGSQKFCGIIDRDARSDDEVTALATRGIFCFPFFEAESLLLLPQIATMILSQKSPRTITSEAYIPVLLECAKASRNRTFESVMKHLCYHSSATIKYVPTDDGVKDVEILNPDALRTRFEARAKELSQVLAAGNHDEIIKSFDGKDLCAQMANRSHAAFTVEFGAHPNSDYAIARDREDFKSALAEMQPLVNWASQIKAHLSA